MSGKFGIFGPSRKEIWKQLSEEIQADYVDGGFWKNDKVVAFHRNWMITLDTYTVSTGKSSQTYTRIRAPYVNRDDFLFTIYRKSFFTGIGKLFGLKDIEVGYPEFDEAFIIQGNDERKLQMMFSNPQIRELIGYQPAILLQLKDDEGWFKPKFPEGVNELYFQTYGVIKDLTRLHDLYDLFAVTLDHLCEIGTAYEDDPTSV
ncbi:MAG: DUF3137 domain-containing protein [Bacteroidia bacterium]|nr:DUF3137 domain-containing protein [Bacteroidia bacterium]